jgi:hypothetical protein
VPKLLVPSETKIKEINNKTAEILTYDGRNPDAIRDFMPSGLPPSIFGLMDLAKTLAGTIGGLNQASIGQVPAGIKSGKGLEALQAADAENNVAEPIANLGLFYKELVERVFEVLAEYQTERKEMTVEESGQTEKVAFIGAAGMQLQDGSQAPLQENTIVINPSKVKVTTVPAIAYSEDGKRETLKELFTAGAIDVQTLLEGYRFQNVSEIVERTLREMQMKAQEPPRPTEEASKLMKGLKDMAESGAPIDLEQFNAVLAHAGLPPVQLAPLAPAEGLVDTSLPPDA